MFKKLLRKLLNKYNNKPIEIIVKMEQAKVDVNYEEMANKIYNALRSKMT